MHEVFTEQSDVTTYREAHEEQYQQLRKLCWGCPGCGMKEKEIKGGFQQESTFVEEEYCLNSGCSGLHIDWILPMLLNDDGTWIYPEICDDYGKQPPSILQFMVKPIKKESK